MNRILPLFLLLLFTTSCVTKKVNVIDFSVSPKNAKELIARVNSKNKSPDWLSLKGKINLKKEAQDITLTINIKHRKDSVIWASISAPFGIELFRTILTKDSIYYLNRTNKTYFKKPILHISTFLKADISFYEIQEMITANPSILKQSYKFKSHKNTFELSAKEVTYKVSADFYRILNASILDGDNELIYEFSAFTNEAEFIFPKKFKLKVKSVENFETTLTYSKIAFNEKQKLPFKIPSSYVQVE